MPYNGAETFSLHDDSTDTTLLDFWSWAYSDLNGNINRAVLGEFIVSAALGIERIGREAERQEWREYDLDFKGIHVEVKTAAQVQGWKSAKRSPLSFGIGKALRFDEQSGKYIPGTQARHSHVYVFAVYTASDKDRDASPLNLDLWEFYVVNTADIDRLLGEQKSIRLSSLKANLPYIRCEYVNLRDTVLNMYSCKKQEACHPSPKRLFV